MASKKKAPIIGAIFSSDSSDDDISPQIPIRAAKTDGSGTERRRPVSIRVSMTSNEDRSGSESSHSNNKRRVEIPKDLSSSVPDGYIEIDKQRIQSIVKHNTLIQYETHAGKLIKPKYFKKCDAIAGTIVVGFFKHNKRNYSEAIKNIKSVFINKGIHGGADALKETIELPKDQWNTIRRDMVISYEKEDHEFVYRVKFNSFIKGPDGSSRMSLTSERGFNYVANPAKLLKIYRHVTGNDKTLTFILEALRKLETRIKQLEANQKKKTTH